MTDPKSRSAEISALAHLAAIVESSDDAIISKDLSGIIQSWNPAAERIYGYSKTEAIGRPITMLIPEDRLPEETVILQKIREGQRVDHYETVRRRKDGRLITVSLTVSPIMTPTGTVVGASKSARDITERKRIEEDLRALTLELDSRVAQRTQALMVSQERLRTLATQLSLSEERVRRKIANELHDYLGQMLVVCRLKLTQATQGTKESDTAQQLQDADRILQDSISYTRSLVAQLTPPILREFGLVMGLTWLADQMKQHGLTVSLKLEIPSVEVDEEQAILLFQSVRELLMNVVKHAGTTEATVIVGLAPDNLLKVTVTDRGKGFDSAREQATADMRFGLFSIREQMEAVSGKFEITSRPDHGTTATLILSLAPAQPATATPSAANVLPVSAANPLTTPAVRIVMVDDHSLVRQGMRNVIESFDNMRVVGEAADGQEAVHLAQNLRPDVVILDVNMPKMDGVEATRIIKQQCPEIAIIGLSVNNSRQVEAAMHAAGASAYLTKDTAPEQLYNTISAVLIKRLTDK